MLIPANDGTLVVDTEKLGCHRPGEKDAARPPAVEGESPLVASVIRVSNHLAEVVDAGRINVNVASWRRNPFVVTPT